MEYVSFTWFTFNFCCLSKMTCKIIVLICFPSVTHSAVHHNCVTIKLSFVFCLYISHLLRTAAYLLHLMLSHVNDVGCVSTCFAWKCANLAFQPKCFACLCNWSPHHGCVFCFFLCLSLVLVHILQCFVLGFFSF